MLWEEKKKKTKKKEKKVEMQLKKAKREVMRNMKQKYDTAIRPKLRLAEVERLIEKNRIIVPPPRRQKLINMCEDGTFETVGNKPTSIGWLIYEDSFWTWVRGLDGEK